MHARFLAARAPARVRVGSALASFRSTFGAARTAAAVVVARPPGEGLSAQIPWLMPETLTDVARFEACLAAEIGAAELGAVCTAEACRAAAHLPTIAAALARLEERRARGEDVGIATSLVPTRDHPGTASEVGAHGEAGWHRHGWPLG